jgi:hypothetical protein
MHRKDYTLIKKLVRKPQRKTPFGRPRCRWEDNVAQDKDQW